MSFDLYTYGTTKPVYFKLTLSGTAVTGYSLVAADVTLQKDGGAAANIGTECSETTGAKGWYEWQPSASSQTSAEVLIINIADSVGSSFDENGMTIATGGSASARFGG